MMIIRIRAIRLAAPSMFNTMEPKARFEIDRPRLHMVVQNGKTRCIVVYCSEHIEPLHG
jgi:hypothetical protein